MDSTFVDILKDVTLQSIEFIKTNSPYLWAMARQRVMTIAYIGVIVGSFLTVSSIVSSYVIHKIAQHEANDDIYMLNILSSLVLIIGLIAFFSNLTTLLSIDYATIHLITDLIKP